MTATSIATSPFEVHSLLFMFGLVLLCLVVETDTTNQYFPGEEVYKNLLMVDDETAEICDREGLEKFEVLIKKMEDITENKDGGVYKRLVKPGSGPVVPQGALVRGEGVT